jgi:hypothetical protein
LVAALLLKRLNHRKNTLKNKSNEVETEVEATTKKKEET